MDDTLMTVVGLSDIPETIRSHDTLTNPDYVDVFTAPASGATDRTPEEWARAVLEETPTGRAAPALWRRLGLRLGPTPSAEHVQGLKIAARGDDWIRLETASWFMTAHGIVHTDDHQLSIALCIRYDHPIASVVWMPESAVHRRAVPVMLRQALTSVHDSRK
ncbi:MAG TPA: hypothetical protein VE466_08110 [Acidimicrobiales bacterium]|nr:hypothetical protein [Acidimicrobiales bacterium]